jgi:hypothetical protein
LDHLVGELLNLQRHVEAKRRSSYCLCFVALADVGGRSIIT